MKNIPFSLALRIVRICSTLEMTDKRLTELKDLLMERDYKPDIIDAALNKARAIPRSRALKHVAVSNSDTRQIFSVMYDPRLPDIQSIVNKHWRAMTSLDTYLSDVFNEPPLIAYKGQKNMKDFLVRAKVFPKSNCHEKNKS